MSKLFQKVLIINSKRSFGFISSVSSLLLKLQVSDQQKTN